MHRCGTYVDVDEWQEFQLSRDPSPSRIQVKNKRMKKKGISYRSWNLKCSQSLREKPLMPFRSKLPGSDHKNRMARWNATPMWREKLIGF